MSLVKPYILSFKGGVYQWFLRFIDFFRPSVEKLLHSSWGVVFYCYLVSKFDFCLTLKLNICQWLQSLYFIEILKLSILPLRG